MVERRVRRGVCGQLCLAGAFERSQTGLPRSSWDSPPGAMDPPCEGARSESHARGLTAQLDAEADQPDEGQGDPERRQQTAHDDAGSQG